MAYSVTMKTIVDGLFCKKTNIYTVFAKNLTDIPYVFHSYTFTIIIGTNIFGDI